MLLLFQWDHRLSCCSSKDSYIASAFDQRSANEREQDGDLHQARAATCRPVSSKTFLFSPMTSLSLFIKAEINSVLNQQFWTI